MDNQTENHAQALEQQEDKRPVFVTLVAGVVFFLAIDNLITLSATLSRGEFISTLSLALPIWILVTVSVLKGVSYLVIAFGLWFRWAVFKKVSIIMVIIFQIITLGRYIFFVQGTYESGRLIFLLASILLLDILLIVGLLNPSIGILFGKRVQKETLSNDT